MKFLAGLYEVAIHVKLNEGDWALRNVFSLKDFQLESFSSVEKEDLSNVKKVRFQIHFNVRIRI